MQGFGQSFLWSPDVAMRVFIHIHGFEAESCVTLYVRGLLSIPLMIYLYRWRTHPSD